MADHRCGGIGDHRSASRTAGSLSPLPEVRRIRETDKPRGIGGSIHRICGLAGTDRPIGSVRACGPVASQATHWTSGPAGPPDPPDLWTDRASKTRRASESAEQRC
ncbi:hypothetical protein GCM10011578_078260 [Streptomyces fuscichromogenes]|uniref:Uncharacterized protein n=1 Tax=Streptomyces fuscichromogenes TaxID=1324013 RepID=A0A918CVQ9_9ACTN|nr:hypothetical protein GCM10011578_078260 [Streptomyces fuscichromogenes]